MSYPRKLQILIVEDDSEVIESYRESFAGWKGDGFSVGNLVFARSLEDATERINGYDIFHVVILDMNLPLRNRESAIQGVEPGEQLLGLLSLRTTYPVPVVLVVSGRLNEVGELNSMQRTLNDKFWHGRMVNKGVHQWNEVRAGLEEAYKYLDVGIHIRDSGNEFFPTLAPQEVDLLRRCVLAQDSALGVDLKWWSAETGRSTSRPTENDGPTKVLMGAFLLDNGLERSIPTFFKFEPSGNGPFARSDTQLLSQKLAHVQSVHSSSSSERSLLVTQSVTNKAWPISLTEYLQRDSDDVSASIKNLIHQVVEQLNGLGSREDDEVLVGQLFQNWIDNKVLRRVWKQLHQAKVDAMDKASPIAVFDKLKQSVVKCWAPRRPAHGDLNATNIAIDAENASDPRAFIFDAAGVGTDFELRDLATLEVTTILFNSVGIDQRLMEVCEALYQQEFVPTLPEEPITSFARNVFEMISTIRARLTTSEEQEVYAVLLLNAALGQVCGLGFQPSPNNVKNPDHACLLAGLIAKWLPQVASRLFTVHEHTNEAAKTT